MKLYLYYCWLVVSLTVLIHLICNWLQIDSDFKNYLVGIAVGYIACKMNCRKQIEACNKLILEIKEILPRLK